MEGDKPVKLTACVVVNEVTKVVVDPYAAVVPYATWEVAATSVVQSIVAVEAPMDAAFTAEMTGGALVVALVVKVKSPDVDRSPCASVESTW